MEQFKEFTGKNLDDAISEACSFYDADREQLEIEIIQDAKSGIFGLVGARKAKIHARRVELRQAMEDLLGRKAQDETEKSSTETVAEKATADQTKATKEKPVKEKAPKEKAEKTQRTDSKPVDEKAESPKSPEPKAESPKEKRERTPKPEKQKIKRQDETRANKERKSVIKPTEDVFNGQENMADLDDMDDAETSHHIPFEELDKERMSALSLEAVNNLVQPIVGDVPMQVEFHENRVCVHLECGEDSGLLIGREGQTLSALQYVASRIVSRGMSAAVRVQLDAGDYRSRQDEKLRELALALADRVRHTGKSYSTRPLSSYHRRVVHMALQDAHDILTRSSGEGPLKRVIVQKKR